MILCDFAASGASGQSARRCHAPCPVEAPTQREGLDYSVGFWKLSKRSNINRSLKDTQVESDTRPSLIMFPAWQDDAAPLLGDENMVLIDRSHVKRRERGEQENSCSPGQNCKRIRQQQVTLCLLLRLLPILLHLVLFLQVQGVRKDLCMLKEEHVPPLGCSSWDETEA